MQSYRERIDFSAGIAIGPILFVVAILAVLVGAIAAGSGGFGSSTADEAARVRASTIVQQAVTIKGAFDRIVVNGATPSQVVVAETGFSGSSTLALYGSFGGGITPQSPPRDAVPSGSTWRFASDADLPGIGSSGANDYVTVLQVNLQTCNALNDLIFGRGEHTTPLSMGGSGTVTINAVAAGDTVADTGNAFTISGAPPAALTSRTSACVTTSGSYYYYQLLAAG
jgi:hypothetical protein